jgi:hypothetical protein
MQINVFRNLGARAPVVFETVADIMNWPETIGSVKEIELLTPGPVRVGARLRALRTVFGRETREELELIELEQPRRLRLVAESRNIRYERDHIVDAVTTGSRLMLILRSKPTTQTGRALQPFLTPFMEINLRDEMERDLADLAAAIALKSSAELSKVRHV